MNKKYIIPLFAILGIALVSAVLVPYLSTPTKVTVDVASPFEIRSLNVGQVLPVYADLDLVDLVDKSDVVGGDTYEVTFGFKALSNNAMDVIEQYVIGGNGTTCADFVEIGWYTCTINCTEWADYNTLDLSDTMYCNDSSGQVIINAPNSYPVGVINVNKLKLTLQPEAEGDYSVSAQVLPVSV